MSSLIDLPDLETLVVDRKVRDALTAVSDKRGLVAELSGAQGLSTVTGVRFLLLDYSPKLVVRQAADPSMVGLYAQISEEQQFGDYRASLG